MPCLLLLAGCAKRDAASQLSKHLLPNGLLTQYDDTWLCALQLRLYITKVALVKLSCGCPADCSCAATPVQQATSSTRCDLLQFLSRLTTHMLYL
jgi:hypothetical protein